jgi:DNA-binding transcriptional LysR family regulator
MDRLFAMEAFVRVVDAGSFSGAANQLRIGQSAISKTIAQLEERLRVRLLFRSTHGLAPTEAGRNFYEGAKRSITEVEAAEFAARGAAETLSGRLRIHATVAFARLHVIPQLPNFLALHPALDADLVLDDRNVDFIEAGIDVGFRSGFVGNSTLMIRKIAQCQRRVIGTPGYFDAVGMPQVPTDLKSHQCVVYDYPLGNATWTFRRGVAKETVSVGGRVRLNGAVGVRACVLEGLGLAIASEWMFAAELRGKVVKPVLTGWSLPPVDAWAVFPPGRQASAKARAFAAHVSKRISETTVEKGFADRSCDR